MARYHTRVNTGRGSPLSGRWDLDPEAVFLNHGSFGACPHAVLQHQSELRARLERQPVDFFVRQYYPLLDDARHVLASFLGADAEGLAFVPNATTGVNSVVRSMDLRPDDELLVSENQSVLLELLLHHVVDGSRLTMADILATQGSLLMASGKEALVDPESGAIGSVAIAETVQNLLAANGVVHALVAVMIVPES